MRKGIKIFLITVIVLLIADYVYFVYPAWGIPFNKQRYGQLPLTPSWALKAWLWEDDVNTAAYVDELLEGYEKYDIPVRTIILDSPWSLRYNDFEVDTILYPNPEQWFGQLQDSGYRVVLWMTSAVNSYSKDTRVKNSEKWFNSAKDNGYLLGGDDILSWWKGKGKFVDYTNPDAMKWWRGMQQKVFDYGIDGWKLDGAATLAWTEIFGVPFFYKMSSEGLITTREYMDMYYREEYRYGLTQNSEFITLTRSVDRKRLHPEGFTPFDASPINWVGDQKHAWEDDGSEGDTGAGSDDLVVKDVKGIGMALTHIMQSAELGYNIIGSDIAGFSGRKIPPRLYIRWTQFSTFCGLFLNGGHAERRLWKRTTEELEIIRRYTWLHNELIPYMYHYVVTAHNGGKRLQTPMKKGKYHYMFGDDFLVAPIYTDTENMDIYLPEGQWRYLFNDTEVYEGDSKINMDIPIDEFPVFVKEGAIIPFDIKCSYTGFGSEENEGFTTFYIYPQKENSFDLYEMDNPDVKTVLSYKQDGGNLEVTFTGKAVAHILNIKLDDKPSKVIKDGVGLEDTEWMYSEPEQKLTIINSDTTLCSYKMIT